jgi:hypothetical protein
MSVLTNTASEKLEALDAIVTTDADGYQHKLALIKLVMRDLKALEEATRQMAVEDGYAVFRSVTIKEHVRKEHTQKRFTWIV